MNGPVRGVLAALAWLAVIVVIALGGAGLVTALDHPPGTAARTDLTIAGDAEVGPQLDAANSDLQALADQVEALGIQARGALAAMNGTDTTTGEAAIAEGDALVTDVIRRTRALRTRLAAVPYVGLPNAGLHVSAPLVARHDALVAALDATDGLDASWNRLSVGALSAAKMSFLLAEHDRLAGEATDRGRNARYTEAIKLIDQAAAQLDAARTVRNQLANTVDVSVLDEWIARNAAYDVALRDLYLKISKVGRKVTAAVRAAVKAEAAARANLPPDRRAMVVIMADIARGGMNGAVIAIEEARATLADALEDEAAGASPSPGSSDGP
jgi:hypothetical protein